MLALMVVIEEREIPIIIPHTNGLDESLPLLPNIMVLSKLTVKKGEGHLQTHQALTIQVTTFSPLVSYPRWSY
jgi:hypothetical protein